MVTVDIPVTAPALFHVSSTCSAPSTMPSSTTPFDVDRYFRDDLGAQFIQSSPSSSATTDDELDALGELEI
jgi:hypothetical protein